MKIPFSPPYIDDDIRKEVLEALNSGWITTGPKAQALEKLTAKFAGVEFANCTNSATSTLSFLTLFRKCRHRYFGSRGIWLF